jgi:hypothetical protein
MIHFMIVCLRLPHNSLAKGERLAAKMILDPGPVSCDMPANDFHIVFIVWIHDSLSHIRMAWIR